jgi:hypothetical protein
VRHSLIAAVSLALAGVPSHAAGAPTPADTSASPVARQTAAAQAHVAAREALPFIADDYPRAVAEARSKKLPIFVESWAPW